MKYLVTRPRAVLLAALLAAGAQAQPVQRKPGLWSMAMDGRQMPFNLCVGNDGDDLTKRPQQDDPRNKCSPPQWRRESTQRAQVSSTCQSANGVKSTTTMVISGDFERAITIDMTTRYEPPQPGGDVKSRLDYHWQGPCPAGAKSGAMVLPNGQVMDPSKMMGGMTGGRR